MHFLILDRIRVYERGFEWENTKEMVRAADILKAYVRYDDEKYTCCVVVSDPDSGDKRDYYINGDKFTKAEAEDILHWLKSELE